ncbi:hypothetical protein BAC3_02075 [uncultured bacterium]|nr:hypothetical protein BAC3_02075 [uncultured bacterium]
MNPELKQRLIGAAVVTALATIFIPMMFDDPVENKGQTVSELKIPETPVKSTEESANKLTTPATNKTTATKPSANPVEEASDAELEDPEAEANAEPPVNETTPTQQTENGTETVAEAEPTAAEEEPEPLDTGVVPEAKIPTKKPKTTEPEVVVEDVKVKPTVKKTDKTVATSKPVETPTTAKPITNKKPETPTPTPIATTEKPKNPELQRWVIHAGSFAQKDNATALMKSLREQHIPVVMETIPSAKGTMYRLKVGPELDKKKAAANKAKLDKQGVTNVMFSE